MFMEGILQKSRQQYRRGSRGAVRTQRNLVGSHSLVSYFGHTELVVGEIAGLMLIEVHFLKPKSLWNISVSRIGGGRI
jgi:hypothetical protein